MGSVTSIVKNNATVYNVGGRNVTTSGVFSARAKSSSGDTPIWARDSAGLGTNADLTLTQYATSQISHKQKTTTSKDDTLVSLVGEQYLPTAAIEEEIANKYVTQNGVVNTGRRQVVRNSEKDVLVGRK